MSMFCYQCQEAYRNIGCSIKGVCGKKETTSNLQDLLIYVLKGISSLSEKNSEFEELNIDVGKFISKSLFVTITNANFDDLKIKELIKEGVQIRNKVKEKFLKNYKNKHNKEYDGIFLDAEIWEYSNENELQEKALKTGILSSENEDVRSLRELLIIGIKGIAAYADHAEILGYNDFNIYNFLIKALASTLKTLNVDEMVNLVLEAGKISVDTMALLDKANTDKFGNPEITKVNLGVGNNPGILISGHDLKDMEELLIQTRGTGVDVYTHSEMLPAHYYPVFKKYEHLRGNYGSSWWKQSEDFTSFNGPILMTTNCITPVKDSYKDRIFTTGNAGYEGVKHINDRINGKRKDFSEIIELAKICNPPKKIEEGEIVGGFAHNQVLKLASTVIDAIKAGAIKKFIVMAGCDGRQNGRNYFTEVAINLPKDTIILTAGCAKYRYNKLNLGDIGGIPRVLDAGQCNDSYSLAVVALKLKEVFELNDINDLPIEFDLAWYEQKAVAVLLALLHLGFKGIRIGPSIPAFLSTNVLKVLVENFDIKPIKTVEEDIQDMIDAKKDKDNVKDEDLVCV